MSAATSTTLPLPRSPKVSDGLADHRRPRRRTGSPPPPGRRRSRPARWCRSIQSVMALTSCRTCADPSCVGAAEPARYPSVCRDGRCADPATAVTLVNGITRARQRRRSRGPRPDRRIPRSLMAPADTPPSCRPLQTRPPPRRRRGHRPGDRPQPSQPHGIPAAHLAGRLRAEPAPGPHRPRLLQPRPRGRRVRRQRPHHDGRRHRREPRHHHVLQRHALGARAVRALPRSDEADRPRGRRGRPRRRWRARDVRRHHPGPGGHGAQPVQPRRHRDVDGDRALPRRLRRRPDARRLRQDRARAGGRRAVLRPPADRAGARRSDGLGPLQRREGRDPQGVRRRRGRARRAARERGRVLPLARHLHLLRHRQLQPDAHGRHGAAPARRGVRPPRRPAA